MHGDRVPISLMVFEPARHDTACSRHPPLASPARQDIHTVKFQTDYPACPPTEHGERVRLQIIDRPPEKSGEQTALMCWYDVKGFCFFGCSSRWPAPGEFTAHGEDPHFTISCYCPGRMWLRPALALALNSLAGLGSTPLVASKPVAEA